jgi:hypothetical protein
MRTMSIVSAAPLVACAWLAACRTDVTGPHAMAPFADASTASLVPIDVLGSNHVPPGQACKAAAYHEFDFWVGNWDVRGPAGGLAGTNVVKSRLGGCVVEENWTSAGVGFGRSLNFYDAAAGTWSQMWVASNGCPNGVIIIEGTFANGAMTMRGTKVQPEGFQHTPPCTAPPAFVTFAQNNLIRWTPLESGSVLQQFTASNNDTPLPEPPAPSTGAGLRYDRVAQVAALTPPDPSFCPGRAAAHQFDFMIGTWDVHQSNGNGSKATASFSKDMHDCLIEENVSGPGQYEGLSFNTFDVYTQHWHRTYVDTDGVRLLLEGTLINGSMVLSGTKQGEPGTQVRVSWIPDGSNHVLQRWEFSRDNAATWTNAKELAYTR